jgi:uncharacterized oxidoreductase
MILERNTVLITGGSSGIGFELAKHLIEKNNKVLICGRSLEKLEKAKSLIPQIEYLQCDISQTEDCIRLSQWIKQNHPTLNVLVNNAAIVHVSNFYSNADVLNEARQEIETNLMAPIVLCKLLIPVIEKNPKPHIVNITTGLVYAPKADYPFYNATKSALHSFTQVLRKQLSTTEIRIKEVMFPAVNTPWHKGNPPKIAISTQNAVTGMIKGLQGNKDEIRLGGVNLLYWISRIAPAFAFKKINEIH